MNPTMISATVPPRGNTVQRHAMTIDVEDYFQVQAFAGAIRRADWDQIPCRVEANVERLLAQLDRAGAKATFFTLGWIAERHPTLVRRVVAAGHELASHGYDHTRADTQQPGTFRADIRRAKRILEDVGGVRVIGYRAATFSIGARNPWAFGILAEEGHRYSSSTYPVKHDLYGDPDGARAPYIPAGTDLLEIPMTTLRIGGRNLPCSGGGYFRLLPYPLFRWMFAHCEGVTHQPGVFYLHPWEIDPDQPRVAAPRLARLRHYTNLRRTAVRLDAMLRDFSWDRMDRIYAGQIAAAA